MLFFTAPTLDSNAGPIIARDEQLVDQECHDSSIECRAKTGPELAVRYGCGTEAANRRAEGVGSAVAYFPHSKSKFMFWFKLIFIFGHLFPFFKLICVTVWMGLFPIPRRSDDLFQVDIVGLPPENFKCLVRVRY